MILDAASVDRDLELSADACVVGSGAGGAVVARELQASGLSVVVLEEGRYWTSRDFSQLEEEMYPRLYRERGTKPTADFSVLVSQGRALGGSTIGSFCVCFRPPRQILVDWRERFGLEDLSYEKLFPYIERVERQIGVKAMGPEQLNENNRKLLAGSERLGYRGRFLHHNRTDCLGCGYCALGCAYDRKGDALTTQLADASRLGARILPEVRVERILTQKDRATGVVGRTLGARDGREYEVRVRAPVVVICAGALESAMLWLRSALPNPHRVVGRHLHLHPYLVAAGVFEEEIASWEGAPQSYVVDEFLNLDKRIDGGFLLFSGSVQPIAFAGLLPGFGGDHRRLMSQASRIAIVAIMLHDRTEGRVLAGRRGQAVVRYELNPEDKERVQEGLATAVDILFAAGARSVVLPYNERVELGRREEREIIRQRGILANDPLFLSFHPQGTLRMGTDPKTSMVTSTGAAHAVRGLWVADSSVFPTSIAVPPQISIMAFAARTAEAIR